MAKKKQAVMILFNGLTNNGKVYAKGEIEKNPSNYLIKAAKERIKQFHRDEGKESRLARFVDYENEDFDYSEAVDELDEVKISRSPVVEEIDDLNDMNESDLVKLSRSFGLKKDVANSLDIDKMISFCRFMRRL